MHYFQKVCVVLVMFIIMTHFGKGSKITSERKVLENQNICQAQPNGAILENPKDCHKFHMCIQQKAYEYNCDPAHHYNASTRSCVVGPACNNHSNKTATCAFGNIRAVPNNCYIFEACVNGQYEILNCPSNYYFNARKAICLPFKYDAEFKCNCLMPEYTVLENKNNCETYFVCRRKTAVLETCPLGQYYKVELNTCLIDLLGACLIKPTILPEQTDDTKTDIPAICSNLGLKDIHFETFPKGCNTFFICVNGKLYTQHCPQNFYYDSDKKYCVFDATKICSDTEDLN